MLTAHIRISQDCIEPLNEVSGPVKEEKTGHYFFDDFRSSIHYHHNKDPHTSGVGALAGAVVSWFLYRAAYADIE